MENRIRIREHSAVLRKCLERIELDFAYLGMVSKDIAEITYCMEKLDPEKPKRIIRTRST